MKYTIPFSSFSLNEKTIIHVEPSCFFLDVLLGRRCDQEMDSSLYPYRVKEGERAGNPNGWHGHLDIFDVSCNSEEFNSSDHVVWSQIIFWTFVFNVVCPHQEPASTGWILDAKSQYRKDGRPYEWNLKLDTQHQWSKMIYGWQGENHQFQAHNTPGQSPCEDVLDIYLFGELNSSRHIKILGDVTCN